MEGADRLIEKLSWKAILLLCACLAIPTFYVGLLVRNTFGMMGNFALAAGVVVIGVPWAFYSSRR